MLLSLDDEFNQVIKDSDLAEADDEPGNRQASEYDVEDLYLNMELGIIRDDEGTKTATSRNYKIEYTNGTTEVFATNIIAESQLAQADDKGERQMMINEIEDHRKTAGAVPKERLELALDYRGR